MFKLKKVINVVMVLLIIISINIPVNIDAKSIKEESIDKELKDAKKELEDVLTKIEDIQDDMGEVRKYLKDNNRVYTEVKEELEDKEKEYGELEEDIDERLDVLKGRIKSYQKSGGEIGYLEVILETKTFWEMLNTVRNMKILVGADQDILDELEEDRDKLDNMLEELETLKGEYKKIGKEIKEQEKLYKEKELELQEERDEISEIISELELEKSELKDLEEELLDGVGVFKDTVEEGIEENKVKENNNSLEDNNVTSKKGKGNIKEGVEEERQEVKDVESDETGEEDLGGTGEKTSKDLGQEVKGEDTRGEKTPKTDKGISKKDISKGSKLEWPVSEGYISSPMGKRWGKEHKGIDIARTDRGTKPSIYSAESGVVEVSEYNNGGYGNMVIINHGNGLKTLYAHLDSVSVSKGNKVDRGSFIGIMGETGRSTGIHLHFEVHENGAVKDPESYF